MNKKGAELSITVIVVIILALLVLIVVALIFLGGSTGLTQRLKNVFLPQQAIALDLARQNCEQWCSFAEGMTPESARESSYCRSVQKGVDRDRDGNPDRDEEGKKLMEYVCWEADNGLGVPCGVDCLGQ